MSEERSEVMELSTPSGSALPKSTFGEQAVYTPDGLANSIVKHFQPTGSLCEPCRGGGVFTRAMGDCDWFEIEEGRDFLASSGNKWDWVITNPPWKEVKGFLEKSMEQSDNVVMLTWLTGVLTKARIRMIQDAGFGFKDFLLVPTPPKPWPQSGFQLSATYIKRGWEGPATFSSLQNKKDCHE